MPKQDFNINTKSGAAGDTYGINITNSQRNSYVAADDSIAYGVAVQKVGDRKCKAGILSTGEITGISMRSNNLEALNRPSDGTVKFRKGDVLSVMEGGYIQVIAQEAVAQDGTVYVDSITGLFYATKADGRVAAINCKYYLSASTGDIVPVYIEVHITPPTP